ncbi:MAG: class I SAM-dependent methyltransferase [Deltaproteobacteria bacterium]|nr:class I SAM-dependent methyltransferase [Deltaproteobacteria bacterium]
MNGHRPVTCNACGGDLARRFEDVRDPQTLELFSIALCGSCGLGHTSPQPADLSRYYGPAYHGGRHGFTAKYCAWRRVRWLSSQVTSKGTLLDVGCGDGTFLLQAQAKGWHVVGTEMNPKVARAQGLDVGETLDDVAALGPFQAITLWHSLEHMRDPRGTLERVRHLLSPGGRIVVAVPNAQGWQARVFGAGWFHLDVPRHLYHFSERALDSLFGTVGLRVTKKWHHEVEIDLMGWSQSALNRTSSVPNVFFHSLTGRPTRVGRAWEAASFVVGGALSALAIPASAGSAWLGQGATLIAVAEAA